MFVFSSETQSIVSEKKMFSYLKYTIYFKYN